jgi:hypothetical protein
MVENAQRVAVDTFATVHRDSLAATVIKKLLSVHFVPMVGHVVKISLVCVTAQ